MIVTLFSCDHYMYSDGPCFQVLRVFGAPQNFVGNLCRISGVDLSHVSPPLLWLHGGCDLCVTVS